VVDDPESTFALSGLWEKRGVARRFREDRGRYRGVVRISELSGKLEVLVAVTLGRLDLGVFGPLVPGRDGNEIRLSRDCSLPYVGVVSAALTVDCEAVGSTKQGIVIARHHRGDPELSGMRPRAARIACQLTCRIG